jgi:hypothetical protein
MQPLSDSLLSLIEAREENTVLLANCVGDDGSLLELERKACVDQRRVDLQQTTSQGLELRNGQATVTFSHGFGESERDAGPNAHQRRLLDPELPGNRVGGAKADAADVTSQTIRIGAHDLDRVDAVGLEDPHRAGGAHAVAVQEHHDFADDLLVGPGRGDPGGTLGADARDPPQASRLCLDDVEDVGAELSDKPPGVDRSDATDHP